LSKRVFREKSPDSEELHKYQKPSSIKKDSFRTARSGLFRMTKNIESNLKGTTPSASTRPIPIGIGKEESFSSDFLLPG